MLLRGDFTSRKSFLKLNETWIHFDLKTIEILKYQTHKINTCSKSTVETLE